MFIDEARIYVQAGRGGNGCESFYFDRRKHRRRPHGGNGGRGGHIVFKADHSVDNLLGFKFQQHYKAETGAHGGGNNKHGANGENTLIRVPVGTIIRDEATGGRLRDMSTDNMEVTVCKGGMGGRGNYGNKQVTPGEEGEIRTVLLQLKVLGDVGLVGLPNAGKSTLLNRISGAHSEVGDYPFTTLSPHLGTVIENNGERKWTAVDIPGLIEGAHEGRGLGDRFLRHIERTRILLFMLDMGPYAPESPVRAFEQLSGEITQYGQKLDRKPWFVAANKMDLTGADGRLESLRSAVGDHPLFTISAATGEGVEKLLKALSETLHAA
ncbi:MAG: GTPase ObgE [Candidatus Omnitrophica bacterium]|nr:GTPase ObgE [Candidatus Omnitrophota bacterium]